MNFKPLNLIKIVQFIKQKLIETKFNKNSNFFKNKKKQNKHTHYHIHDFILLIFYNKRPKKNFNFTHVN